MRKKAMSLFPLIILALIVSCDGSSSSSGTSFSTVDASASFEQGVCEADAAVASDTTGDGFCDTFTYFPDDVLITIVSKAKENLHPSLTPSAIKVLEYTVEFIPFENSPAVPAKHRHHYMTILPGGSLECPIRIIDQEDKWDLSHPLNFADYLAFVGAGLGAQYEYTVLVTLKLNEVSSGITETLTVELPLYYYDIAQSCN